jgi:hypothetical protein
MSTFEDGVLDAAAPVSDELPDVTMPVRAAIPAPMAAEVAPLWRILVGGLVLILVISLGGLILTVADGNEQTSPDVLVTVFTSVLTGLVGLFVRSPAQ